MELKITDLLDDLQDNTVQIQPRRVASAQNIKALAMNRVQGASTEAPAKGQSRRISLFVLVAAVILTFATSVFATAHMYTAPTEPTFGTPVPFEVSTYEYSGGYLKSGTLVFTVTGARAVIHEDGIPAEGGFHQYDRYLYLGERWPQDYKYPQFILEDGSFMEGAFLILVDITVESRDAVPQTQDTKPYRFQINDLVCLSEMKLNRIWNVGYFSHYGANHFELLLEPGETVEMTVGFLVGDKWDGSTRDLSTLAICFRENASKLIKFSLGLSNGDLEQKEGG